jgi:ribonuclease HII
MLTIGIDDAGRGPLIGPMILAGVLLKKEQETELKKHNIRDSKIITQIERIALARIIKENSISQKVVTTLPEEIDNSLLSGTNLNTLEAIKTAKVINYLNTKEIQKEKVQVIVDCPSVNTRAWKETLIKYIKNKDNLKISCEHKADANHLSVGAASILAKVAREEEVAKIKKLYGHIGSGYPSDPDTQKFLKNHGKEFKDSGIFRKTWSTWKKMFPGKKQATLDGF